MHLQSPQDVLVAVPNSELELSFPGLYQVGIHRHLSFYNGETGGGSSCPILSMRQRGLLEQALGARL